jgi:hypothetical protein
MVERRLSGSCDAAIQAQPNGSFDPQPYNDLLNLYHKYHKISLQNKIKKA